MLKEGTTAPAFKTTNTNGDDVSLKDFKGQKVALYFYPKDDTPGCTTEACEFRDANDQMAARDAEVWGVSVLGSGSKAAFKAKFGLPFTLLSDESHEVAQQYGTWVEKENYGRKYMGVSRSTFLVDPTGRVARTWPKAKSAGHVAEVLAALDEERMAQPAGHQK